MPYANLKYKLPEETEEFNLAFNGGIYKAAIDDLDNWLREQYKYHNKTTVKIEDVRAKINELLREM